jgi:tight junction protein 1
MGQVVVTLVCVCRAAHKSSKKLFEQCQKLEKVWGHTFSCSITLTSPESWYRKVRELIDKQQSAPVWMSESKVVCQTR